MLSRRILLQAMGAAGLMSSNAVNSLAAAANREPAQGSILSRPLRVRTLTAGVAVSDASDLGQIEAAIAVLKRGRQVLEDAGYEVQTIRVATTSFLGNANDGARERSLAALQELDSLAVANNTIVSIGPVLAADRNDAGLPAWAAELVRSTRTISFSVVIASADRGVQGEAAAVAGRTMSALANALPDGVGNFRFAAAANVPAGTPFFPVAWHQGVDSLAIGVESAGVVEDAFRQTTQVAQASTQLRDLLLYSSVCGTGLDVVPVPGNTSVVTLTALLRDVASLSAKLSKPLSARLFIVPGKKAGEIARFTDPLLTDSVVMKID